jgi:FAD/FMN-containing dehydrogenase
VYLLLPGTPRFADEILAFNRAIVHRPDIVVPARSTADVAAAVAHAAQRTLPITVQATGHGAVMPAEGGVLVSTTRMRGLHVDPVARTLRVGPGTRWSEAVAATARHGLAAINGSATTVGVIGYLTGGGLGPLSRKFGFAADHVRRLEVVTPDGRVRRVDATNEPELFWGVRGGKGNFGIVTAAELGLFPLARLYGGGLYFDGRHTSALLHLYRDWVGTLPPDAHVAVALLRLPRAPHVPAPLAGRLTCHLRITYPGSAADAERDLAPMRALAEPVLDTVREMSYADIGTIHNEPTEPLPRWGRGGLLHDLPAAAVDALVDAVGPEASSALAVVELRPMGSAAALEPEHPNAVAGRGAAFSLNVLGPLLPGREDAAPATGERLLDALSPWTTGSSLINFQGAATAPAEVASAWSPDVYARLQRLKRATDPDHLFRTGHVITPHSALADRVA